MKIVISIFALPYEIDELEKTLFQLKKSSKYISKKIEWVLDVTLCTSSQMTNWKKSSLSMQYFTDKMLRISSQIDWCTKTIKTSEQILGCVSQRRECLKNHPDANFFIWLDTDIIFEETTLAYIENTIQSTYKKYPYSIITPEIVRIWDTTWDCLVNENFIDKPLDYQKTNNPYEDCGVKGDISVETVFVDTKGQPEFKFAGGWFTCISGNLLRKIGIPDSFGHYGYEDTFVMHAAHHLSRHMNIQQFKIKNLVVCENYKYRNFYEYQENLSMIDRREEFKKISFDNFKPELEILVKSLKEK
jgi:hypothetical protein